jgi:hypothetical protein
MAGKRTESDTGRKNGQEVMINITIVEFSVIADYGTKYEISQTPFM